MYTPSSAAIKSVGDPETAANPVEVPLALSTKLESKAAGEVAEALYDKPPVLELAKEG
jgi:hypothetical protein